MSDTPNDRESGFPEVLTAEWIEWMQGQALWPESILTTTGTMFLEENNEPSGVVAFLTLIMHGHIMRDGESVGWSLPISISSAAARQMALELVKITEGIQANGKTIPLSWVREKDHPDYRSGE